MSNTYFKISSSTKTNYPGEVKKKTDMKISLTAFMGGDNILQITCQTDSEINSQSGTGYIQLSKEQCLKLINAINERLMGKISATGYEVSNYTEDPEDPELG
jgi:GTP cyclohydrolase III